MSSATITRDECLVLNELLGSKAPMGCQGVSAKNDDPFVYKGGDNVFKGEDEHLHRNSWLMPRLARRMTKSNKFHVSNWRDAATVDAQECQLIRRRVTEKAGVEAVGKSLPKACGNF
mmetsp:Transcript_26650/g.40890  ORF Transcript_26650/g.40890 Transcript_26650/m.40890 type:complete len:117 (+) Transcript_26650:139-489(+)|eukprot:CAMPEP_0118681902 /NCGR_PEP_ID=MMETSP0800-20121206/5195_1 /TAXON_ID=210618 ORGANISM="Striatella unipunctata, Strain CCMP2910" /NCGR_SAMPLE_ID=MMETSP0800 /ASSEMBLY_ACC=CAM_ASM_000638 /LENGTH=116 /DNA_ID=CAMNT_0006578247 /DNA_START=63 /DNA_END=413 /DNA_ORIENTATION=+